MAPRHVGITDRSVILVGIIQWLFRFFILFSPLRDLRYKISGSCHVGISLDKKCVKRTVPLSHNRVPNLQTEDWSI